MQHLAARAYFGLCLVLGRLLRSGRYSKTRIDPADGGRVRKHRLFYAPFLVWIGNPLLRILGAGVRVLTQREWEERERQIHQRQYGAGILIEADGTLVLPRLTGATLASLLENPDLGQSVRNEVLALAVVALARFHHTGITHGDAMAENVLVDVATGVANWIDFETAHDSSRSVEWRRADDVRALLATCLVRTAPGKIAETLQLILNAYGDERVTSHVARSFSSVWRRPLAFHLAQAGLSYRKHREIACWLRRRLDD